MPTPVKYCNASGKPPARLCGFRNQTKTWQSTVPPGGYKRFVLAHKTPIESRKGSLPQCLVSVEHDRLFLRKAILWQCSCLTWKLFWLSHLLPWFLEEVYNSKSNLHTKHACKSVILFSPSHLVDTWNAFKAFRHHPLCDSHKTPPLVELCEPSVTWPWQCLPCQAAPSRPIWWFSSVSTFLKSCLWWI